MIAENLIGKKVIARSNMAGVFHGTLTEKEGNEITLTNCRKLYFWSGANTVEDLAAEGVKKPENCKFTRSLSQCSFFYDQLVPTTSIADSIIENVKQWKK